MYDGLKYFSTIRDFTVYCIVYKTAGPINSRSCRPAGPYPKWAILAAFDGYISASAEYLKSNEKFVEDRLLNRF